jgi:hypothetical protein
VEVTRQILPEERRFLTIQQLRTRRVILRKTLSYFHKPKATVPAPMRAAEADERVGGTRSKRAQIRDVLRRYEKSDLKEAQAVEEILSIMR